MAIDLGYIIGDVSKNGPIRVMVNDDESVSARSARADFGIKPVVIFLRDDGWTLGAPKHLEEAARQLWAGQWVGVFRHPPNWNESAPATTGPEWEYEAISRTIKVP